MTDRANARFYFGRIYSYFGRVRAVAHVLLAARYCGGARPQGKRRTHRSDRSELPELARFDATASLSLRDLRRLGPGQEAVRFSLPSS